MNRRAFLSVVVAGTTAVSGCLARGRSPAERRGPQRGANQGQFENLVRSLEGVESIDFSIIEEGAGPETQPSIDFDAASHQARITGTMLAGNPCHEAQLATVAYETQIEELSVLVVVGRKPLVFSCRDSLGADTYEVVITLDSRLPDTITATHRNFQGVTFTTTANASS